MTVLEIQCTAGCSLHKEASVKVEAVGATAVGVAEHDEVDLAICCIHGGFFETGELIVHKEGPDISLIRIMIKSKFIIPQVVAQHEKGR